MHRPHLHEGKALVERGDRFELQILDLRGVVDEAAVALGRLDQVGGGLEPRRRARRSREDGAGGKGGQQVAAWEGHWRRFPGFGESVGGLGEGREGGGSVRRSGIGADKEKDFSWRTRRLGVHCVSRSVPSPGLRRWARDGATHSLRVSEPPSPPGKILFRSLHATKPGSGATDAFRKPPHRGVDAPAPSPIPRDRRGCRSAPARRPNDFGSPPDRTRNRTGPRTRFPVGWTFGKIPATAANPRCRLPCEASAPGDAIHQHLIERGIDRAARQHQQAGPQAVDAALHRGHGLDRRGAHRLGGGKPRRRAIRSGRRAAPRPTCPPAPPAPSRSAATLRPRPLGGHEANGIAGQRQRLGRAELGQRVQVEAPDGGGQRHGAEQRVMHPAREQVAEARPRRSPPPSPRR